MTPTEEGSARRELEAFRAKVRRVAIEVADEYGWCPGGLNARLAELGLEPVPIWYDVEVEVTSTQRVTVTIGADNLAEATEENARAYVEAQEGQGVSAWSQCKAHRWELQGTRAVSAKPIADSQ